MSGFGDRNAVPVKPRNPSPHSREPCDKGADGPPGVLPRTIGRLVHIRHRPVRPRPQPAASGIRGIETGPTPPACILGRVCLRGGVSGLSLRDASSDGLEPSHQKADRSAGVPSHVGTPASAAALRADYSGRQQNLTSESLHWTVLLFLQIPPTAVRQLYPAGGVGEGG